MGARNYKTLILEAELTASSPERVYQWLEARANELTSVKRSFEHGDADMELEAALFNRHEPFIDLGLARFSGEMAIAKELFKRAQTEKESPVNSTLRLAVLSNRILGKTSFSDFPKDLFGDDELVCKWLADASSNEIVALFSNPTLDDSFLKDFLERESPWDTLNEKCHLTAVYALATNPRMNQPYEGRMDGWAESSHSSVFDAGWKLAEIVPTTRVWANALWELYNRLERESYSMDNPLDVAKRWVPDASDKKELESEASSNAVGHLDAYQSVRMGLAQLALAKSRDVGPTLLASPDVALRAAAYSRMDLTPEQLLAAYERDKVLAVNYAVHNESLWQSEKTRRALRDISWKAVKDDKHSDLMAANVFNAIRDSMEKKNPKWFADENETSEAPELKPAESAQPATKADVHMILEAVGIRREGSEPLVATLQDIQLAIVGLTKNVAWIWWFSLGALVTLFWR